MTQTCHKCGSPMIPIWVGTGKGSPRFMACLTCGRRVDLWHKKVISEGVVTR